MDNKFILAIALGFSLFSLPLLSYSDAAEKPANTLTKDVWLEKLKAVLPALICKGFMDDPQLKHKLEEMQIDREKCETFIPSSADKCRTKYYPMIPDSINNENAAQWGQVLGECIGRDFAENHLMKKE